MMNGVFHSLRGEFDVSESYSGQAVLGVIVTTIKVSFFNDKPKSPAATDHYCLDVQYFVGR